VHNPTTAIEKMTVGSNTMLAASSQPSSDDLFQFCTSKANNFDNIDCTETQASAICMIHPTVCRSLRWCDEPPTLNLDNIARHENGGKTTGHD